MFIFYDFFINYPKLTVALYTSNEHIAIQYPEIRLCGIAKMTFWYSQLFVKPYSYFSRISTLVLLNIDITNTAYPHIRKYQCNKSPNH